MGNLNSYIVIVSQPIVQVGVVSAKTEDEAKEEAKNGSVRWSHLVPDPQAEGVEYSLIPVEKYNIDNIVQAIEKHGITLSGDE